MSTTRCMVGLLLGALAASAALGCGATKTYQLDWTLDGVQVSGRFDCSKSGIDAIEVIARADGDAVRSVFACYSEIDGPRASGPDLASGPTALSVSTLSAAGQHLSGPVVVDAQIPDEGLVNVSVDLLRPPQCADGVDNDGDGAVDLLDTNCIDVTDGDESS